MRIRYVVQCRKHGVESKDWSGKQVVVSHPKTKKARREGGCPYCAQEARLLVPQEVTAPA